MNQKRVNGLQDLPTGAGTIALVRDRMVRACDARRIGVGNQAVRSVEIDTTAKDARAVGWNREGNAGPAAPLFWLAAADG